MSEGNKTELRVLLGNALLLETSALSALEVSCNGTESERCKTGLEHLFDATSYLVTAAKEIAEANQLQAIKKAEETFRGSKDKDPKVAHRLGMEAVEALEDTETEHE
ncbi:hypothetical protein Q1695_004387 [Nippostrongylus brasiliensis]|nr:hypothetical protein Q1695_004387 [Nippostrongylus brasiliensis]